MALIAIVDYGMGNIHSVARALRHAAPEADIRLCSRAQDLKAAERDELVKRHGYVAYDFHE